MLHNHNYGVTGPYRAYSSLMIFSTRLIMFPTVVSDGWAAIILLPSLRIISIRSPERRFATKGNLHVNAVTSRYFSLKTDTGSRLRQIKTDAFKLPSYKTVYRQLNCGVVWFSTDPPLAPQMTAANLSGGPQVF